jgi:hypothetical protein
MNGRKQSDDGRANRRKSLRGSQRAAFKTYLADLEKYPSDLREPTHPRGVRNDVRRAHSLWTTLGKSSGEPADNRAGAGENTGKAGCGTAAAHRPANAEAFLPTSLVDAGSLPHLGGQQLSPSSTAPTTATFSYFSRRPNTNSWCRPVERCRPVEGCGPIKLASTASLARPATTYPGTQMATHCSGQEAACREIPGRA